MEYETLLQSTFNEITDCSLARFQLNETLSREGKPTIEAFEFDGCMDINVLLVDGTRRQICHETTMSELLQELGL